MGSEPMRSKAKHKTTKCIRVNIFIRNSYDGSKALAREKSQEDQEITPNIFQNIGPSIVVF